MNTFQLLVKIFPRQHNHKNDDKNKNSNKENRFRIGTLVEKNLFERGVSLLIKLINR